MLYFIIIFFVVAADQATKALIMQSFFPHESRPVIDGLFNLVYVTNSGAAFSFLADAGRWGYWFFVAVAALAVIGFTAGWWVWARNKPLLTTAMALIVGGAIGNLIDRLRFGAVVDFLDVMIGSYHWPAFNVADSCVCVGAGLYIVAAMLADRSPKNGTL